MLKLIAGTTLVLSLALAGTAQAGSIEWQQPYFTYSPGAVDFEDIDWTPLDFAAFSAYGGYFANVRQPRFETPLPQLFFEEPGFGIEDEVKMQTNVLISQTFVPFFGPLAFSVLSLDDLDQDLPQGASVPEPGTLALVGIGLLAVARSLRRRLVR